MAQYFAGHGWQDITIAFPVNPRQCAGIAALAKQIHLEVLVEDSLVVERLTGALEQAGARAAAWIKIDSGAGRTGVAWDRPADLLPVARAAHSSVSLLLRGLLTHAGQTYAGRGRDDVCRRFVESVERINTARQAMVQAGMGPLEVSVGDTPGCTLCPDLGAVDEIRPGNFVLHDWTQVQIGTCGVEDVAAALACPVVARHPERSEIVIYGGAIHLSKDFVLVGDRRSYGAVALPVEEPPVLGWTAPLEGAYVSAVSQEHGIIRLLPGDLQRVQVGDLVCILPAHSCLAVTLMKEFVTLDGKRISTLNC
jgi:D-serine deaminase-like pyridoxal phosphate-dependent protein